MDRILTGVLVCLLAAVAASGMIAAGTSPVPAAATPLRLAANTQGAMIVLDESSAGPATLAVGGRLEVRLRAQLGAGFSWALRSPLPPMLKSLGEKIEPRGAGSPPEGGSDTQVFSFEAVASGSARLEFAYRRPFAPQEAPAKLATFEVQVRAP